MYEAYFKYFYPRYIVELSLGVYSLCDLPPSKLSAAALALSMRLLDPASNLETVWNNNLVHYTKYTLEEIRPTVERLATVLINAPSAKLATVYQKYSNKKFMKIARLVIYLSLLLMTVLYRKSYLEFQTSNSHSML